MWNRTSTKGLRRSLRGDCLKMKRSQKVVVLSGHPDLTVDKTCQTPPKFERGGVQSIIYFTIFVYHSNKFYPDFRRIFISTVVTHEVDWGWYCDTLWGRSFLSPDTRLECFWKIVKIFQLKRVQCLLCLPIEGSPRKDTLDRKKVKKRGTIWN